MADDLFVYGVCRRTGCGYVWTREFEDGSCCPLCGETFAPMPPVEADARLKHRQALSPSGKVKYNKRDGQIILTMDDGTTKILGDGELIEMKDKAEKLSKAASGAANQMDAYSQLYKMATNVYEKERRDDAG